MNTAPVFAKLFSVVFFATAALAAVNDGYKSYDGYQVYRMMGLTDRRAEEFAAAIKRSAKDDWASLQYRTLSGSLIRSMDVMVSPEENEQILSIFEAYNIFYEIFIKDVQALIDNENPDIGQSLESNKSIALTWTAYHRVDVIYDWLDQLAETYPEWVRVIVVGNSYEGRLVKGIKITFDEDNPGVFIEGGMHGREWISPAVATYLINEILTSTNSTFNLFARSLNWFVFPVTNPDGYEYTHTTDRLWRKTRKPYADGCVGADANRNWDYFWLNGGASNDSCSLIYAGPEPFSEPEVKALAEYITSVSDKFYIYLSLHSYNQLISLPYGYTTKRIDNYDDALFIGRKAAEALAERYGTEFIVGSIAETIYITSGGSIDWVKGVHNTSLVYTYELRDEGTYGFLLPAKFIIPSALEFIDSIVALVEESRKLGYPDIQTRVREL